MSHFFGRSLSLVAGDAGHLWYESVHVKSGGPDEKIWWRASLRDHKQDRKWGWWWSDSWNFQVSPFSKLSKHSWQTDGNDVEKLPSSRCRKFGELGWSAHFTVLSTYITCYHIRSHQRATESKQNISLLQTEISRRIACPHRVCSPTLSFQIIKKTNKTKTPTVSLSLNFLELNFFGNTNAVKALWLVTIS